MTKIFGRQVDDVRPGDGWRRGWDTPRVSTPDGGTIRARFIAHYIHGNRAPYISVTATTWDKDGREDGGGCMHDAIVAAFPGLAPLVALHLVDVDGQPMHYESNAQYHAAHVMGINHYSHDGRNDPRETFARHVVAGILPDDTETIDALFAPIHVDPPAGVVFELYSSSPASLEERRAVLNLRVRLFCDVRAAALRAHVVKTLRDFRIDLIGLKYPGQPAE